MLSRSSRYGKLMNQFSYLPLNIVYVEFAEKKGKLKELFYQPVRSNVALFLCRSVFGALALPGCFMCAGYPWNSTGKSWIDHSFL